jgi:cell division septation protein DedD
MQHDSAVTQLDSLKNIIASSQSLFTANTTGEVYYVQIGAFKNIDFQKYDPNLVNMFVEVADGMNKLIIGGFLNFDDACNLRKDIVRIGIKNAFIVKKVDGVRVKFSQWCQ